MRNTAYRLGAFYSELESQPYKHDFYHAVRVLEATNDGAIPLGTTIRIAQDPIRFRQEPAMDFAPAPIAKFELATAELAVPSMSIRFFGFLGPSGALPIHLTDFAVQRVRNAGDRTIARFLDVFHHRWISIFYRVWANAHPIVSLDRPLNDRFGYIVDSINHTKSTQTHSAGSMAIARRFFAGFYSRGARNADGICAILSHYFQTPAKVKSLVGHWLAIAKEDQTRLAAPKNSALGVDCTIGRSAWDRQGKMEFTLGPMPLARYLSVLPNTTGGAELRGWLRDYFGFGLSCDVRLALKAADVPTAQLGSGAALGWTSWLGGRTNTQDAADLVLYDLNITSPITRTAQ